MDPSRIGVPFASVSNAPPKKKMKPAFSESQEQFRLVKEATGGDLEFLCNNFSNFEKLHTAVVGDSIVDSLCVDNCAVFSLSGGRVAQFYSLLDTLVSYRNIILLIGGNNLSFHDEPGQHPEEVFNEIEKFYKSVRALPQKPTVVICTVLKRLKAKHFNIQRYNSMLTTSDLRFFPMHKEVSKSKCFKESDGIHLTHKGFCELACGINKAMRDHNLY